MYTCEIHHFVSISIRQVGPLNYGPQYVVRFLPLFFSARPFRSLPIPYLYIYALYTYCMCSLSFSDTLHLTLLSHFCSLNRTGIPERYGVACL